MVVLEELSQTSPGSLEWLTWRDIFHLIDIACCCAILFPIVWSIRHLRQARVSLCVYVYVCVWPDLSVFLSLAVHLTDYTHTCTHTGGRRRRQDGGDPAEAPTLPILLPHGT